MYAHSGEAETRVCAYIPSSVVGRDKPGRLSESAIYDQFYLELPEENGLRSSRIH